MRLSIISVVTVVLLLSGLSLSSVVMAQTDSTIITAPMTAEALKLIGLEYSPAELDSALEAISYNLESYRQLRQVTLDNAVAPALFFTPYQADTIRWMTDSPTPQYGPPPEIKRPDDLNDLAFYSVRQLAELIRTRQVTSTELTQLCLDRLARYDSLLHCVITLTTERALAKAAEADVEIAAGNYRGPLHGIPYGAKDLLAVAGYRTTWGAVPYQDQTIETDATVIRKLDSAGAVLVAKLSLGALAWGDVWYADTTRNPWNVEQGSSGSSAGPGSAVAAGLVPFAIGSETWGSIVSPSTRCGTTGLRPTFGRVSKTGAMALSWSMDKLGPMARTVEDCALVFDAIRGADVLDPTLVNPSFSYAPEVDLSALRFGYLKRDFENDTANAGHNNLVLDKLRELGAELIEISLPDIPVAPLEIILSAEAAAAFDELTRSNRDDLLVRQIKNSWPNSFRTARLIPAVEYIQANRVRTLLMQAMTDIMREIDVYISPTFEGDNLLLTNLTGHPCVVLPDGFSEDGTPTSITFMGRLYDEATLLAVAGKYQRATDHHLKHPSLFQ